MRKYLISPKGNFYKANLHTHSTFSDGKWTPAKIKEWYRSHDYSVVAFTDHDIFIPHNELTDDTFVALNGFELGMHTEKYGKIKCCHICLIAKDPENTYPVCLHRTKYMFGNAPQYAYLMNFEEDQPDTEREYSPDFFNSVFKQGREKGFFVTYNHPGWSNEQFEEYSHYEGMNAMEIYNYDGNDYSPDAYDGLLSQGKRLFCIASDDSHDSEKSLGGFVMIKASKLEYGAVMKALEKGDFYSSTGARIKALWAEEDSVHIDCADAERIIFTTEKRTVELKHTSSVSLVLNKDDGYVRITVIDKNGKYAFTNGYFINDIFK